MKICIHESVFPADASIENTLARAAQAGFDAIEMTPAPGRPITLETPEDECRRIAALAADCGLEISALSSDAALDRNFAAPGEADRRGAREQIIAALDRARWLGADAVLIEPGIVGAAGATGPYTAYEDAFSRALDGLSSLRSEAEQRAVYIGCACCLNRFLVSPIEMREFIDLVNSPWIGACLDTAQVPTFGFPQDWISTLGHRIVRVVFGGLDSGTDRIDWKAVRRSLAEARYNGPVLLREGGELAKIRSRVLNALDES